MLTRGVFAVAMLVALPVWAQEDDSATGPDTGRGPVGDSPASTESTPAVSDAQGAVGYTDAAAQPALVISDESVYVIQRRAYSKKKRIELTPLFYTSLNNKFVGHLGVGLSAAYHVRENFGIEITSSIPYLMYAFYSGMIFELYDKEQLAPEAVDMKQMRYFGSASAQFSALYGKFEMYDRLVDYDLYATAGFGVATTVEPCVPNRDGCSADELGIGRGQRTPLEGSDKLKIAGNIGGGLRLFFSENLGFRFELRDIVYSDRVALEGQTTTDIRNNVMLLLGLSFLI